MSKSSKKSKPKIKKEKKVRNKETGQEYRVRERSENMPEGGNLLHKHGEYNGVMGRGSFTKVMGKFCCLECGTLLDQLPEDWVKANPDGTRLLLKGQSKNGPKDPKMQEAGRKAWETRRANQAKN